GARRRSGCFHRHSLGVGCCWREGAGAPCAGEPVGERMARATRQPRRAKLVLVRRKATSREVVSCWSSLKKELRAAGTGGMLGIKGYSDVTDDITRSASRRPE